MEVYRFRVEQRVDHPGRVTQILRDPRHLFAADIIVLKEVKRPDLHTRHRKDVGQITVGIVMRERQRSSLVCQPPRSHGQVVRGYLIFQKRKVELCLAPTHSQTIIQ